MQYIVGVGVTVIGVRIVVVAYVMGGGVGCDAGVVNGVGVVVSNAVIIGCGVGVGVGGVDGGVVVGVTVVVGVVRVGVVIWWC